MRTPIHAPSRPYLRDSLRVWMSLIMIPIRILVTSSYQTRLEPAFYDMDAMEKMLFIQHVSLVRVVWTTSFAMAMDPDGYGNLFPRGNLVLDDGVFVRARLLYRGPFIVRSLGLSSWPVIAHSAFRGMVSVM